MKRILFSFRKQQKFFQYAFSLTIYFLVIPIQNINATEPVKTLYKQDSSQFPLKLEENIDQPDISFLGDKAVILSYNDVHDDTGFDIIRILNDVETVINPSNYDFVLLYTLHEVPGWINSGNVFSVPAKNIGRRNEDYNQSWGYGNWKKLRSVPHMNSVEFLNRPIPPDRMNYGSTLTAFHEMFHYWGVSMVDNGDSSFGPETWNYSYPVAWLGAGSGHWSWVWEEEGMPGIMYSGPTSVKFNAFDLYLMGLLGYDAAKNYVYKLYEYPRTEPPVLHDLTLDDLIYSLSLQGSDYYENNGRRIPDTDPEVKNIQVLIAIVKGDDEQFTEEDQALVNKLADDMSPDWQVATWGLSTLKVSLDYTLTVSKSGMGSGTVTSSPAGISCGTDCSEPYTSGQSVTMTASATSGSVFAGWSGACSGTGTCTVSMTAAKSVTANFTNNSNNTKSVLPTIYNILLLNP